jgi:hypothetical protein
MDFTSSNISGAYFALNELRGAVFSPEQAVMLIRTLGISVRE